MADGLMPETIYGVNESKNNGMNQNVNKLTNQNKQQIQHTFAIADMCSLAPCIWVLSCIHLARPQPLVQSITHDIRFNDLMLKIQQLNGPTHLL